MKSPVAKHLNTFNKASVVPHKQRSMREAIELQEMEETLAEELIGAYNSYECPDVGCSGIVISDEED